MSKLSRILVAAAALLLGGVFVLPLWSVALIAPQYPEGLGMQIRVNTIAGFKENDLANINALNHYIGMKPIVPESIPELRVMPYVFAAMVLFALVSAALGRRRLVQAWIVGMLLVAVAGLADFWRWGYDYGHNLDAEHAIIKVPGMTYQPPLIGTKQLLNFRATSLPAAGAYAAFGAVLLAMGALLVGRTAAPPAATTRGRAAALVLALTSACATPGPREVAYGSDACDYCRMAITDARFGAQVVSDKGKAHTFDSIECMASYVNAAGDGGSVAAAWVGDFSHPGVWIPVDSARFVRTAVSAPMGLALAAYPASAALPEGVAAADAESMSWAEVRALVAARGHGADAHR